RAKRIAAEHAHGPALRPAHPADDLDELSAAVRVGSQHHVQTCRELEIDPPQRWRVDLAKLERHSQPPGRGRRSKSQTNADGRLATSGQTRCGAGGTSTIATSHARAWPWLSVARARASTPSTTLRTRT